MKKKIGMCLVWLIIVSILMFYTAHYLLTIYYLAGKTDVNVNWSGIAVPIFIVDVCMYSGTILLFIVIGIIICGLKIDDA